MIKLLTYDVETSGLIAGSHQIHQLAYLLEIDGVEVESGNLKMRPDPGTPVTPKALETCGITIEGLRAYPLSQAEGYAQFVGMLKNHVDKFNRQDKIHLVGFNERFDNGFLRAWFEMNGDGYFGSWFFADSIDVMVLASYDIMTKGHRPAMENFQLGTVASYYDITPDGDLHDALTDVKVTREIYRKITGAKE